VLLIGLDRLAYRPGDSDGGGERPRRHAGAHLRYWRGKISQFSLISRPSRSARRAASNVKACRLSRFVAAALAWAIFRNIP
jgi:hypothetical protein